MSNLSPEVTTTASIHLVLTVTCDEAVSETLIAMLGMAGFETFEETEAGFVTSAAVEHITESDLKEMLAGWGQSLTFQYSIHFQEPQNWNAQWEASIHPVVVHPRCRIRAAFHAADPAVEFDLVITPKMAFGTGHHATTAQVMRYLLDHEAEVKGTRILDAGSGTGVLAILAEKLGATELYAYDNDPWAVESIEENVALNQCQHISSGLGTITTVPVQGPYDWVLANINRNILLDEMEHYVALLKAGGLLVLSGFNEVDVPVLTASAGKHGMVPLTQTVENGWVMLAFRKQT